MLKKEVIKAKIRDLLKSLFQERNIEVNKIVLFGSIVKGDIKKESDIDIIIVSKDFRRKDIFERVKLATGVGRELVKQIKMPFDLMYYSDKEWENENSLIIDEAKTKGEIIYG